MGLNYEKIREEMTLVFMMVCPHWESLVFNLTNEIYVRDKDEIQHANTRDDMRHQLEEKCLQQAQAADLRAELYCRDGKH